MEVEVKFRELVADSLSFEPREKRSSRIDWVILDSLRKPRNTCGSGCRPRFSGPRVYRGFFLVGLWLWGIYGLDSVGSQPANSQLTITTHNRSDRYEQKTSITKMAKPKRPK